MNEKQTLTFMKKILIFSFIVITVYIIWTQVGIALGFEPNDTITTCVFAFFGTEVVVLMTKKILEKYFITKKEDEE